MTFLPFLSDTYCQILQDPSTSGQHSQELSSDMFLLSFTYLFDQNSFRVEVNSDIFITKDILQNNEAFIYWW